MRTSHDIIRVMGAPRLWLVVCLLAGCEVVFPLEAPPIPDGRPVDPATKCATQVPKTLFCADFDDQMPLIYENGVSSDLVGATGNVMMRRTDPAASDPNAMWIESTGDSYSIDVAPGGPMISRLHTHLEVRFAKFDGTTDYAFASLGVMNAAFTQCTGVVGVFQSQVVVQSLCNDPAIQQSMFVQDLPSKSSFVSVDMTLDVSAGTVTVALGSAEGVTLVTNFASPIPGTAFLRFGAINVAGTPPQVALDDIVVTTP